jgi:small-conductance mechanosensitive channel
MGSLYWLRVLLLVLAIGAVGWLLDWIIRRLERRLSRRLASATVETAVTDTGPFWQRLLLNWGAKGLRTLLWVLFSLFLLDLLPQIRNRFATLGEWLRLTRDHAADWLLVRGVGAVVVLVGTIFVMRFTAALIRTGFELFDQRAAGANSERVRRRSQTLSAILRGAAQIVIFFIGLMILLERLGLNITPILASASIVGIAVGFGAQSLIRDVFAGFLILLEDQYGVGDVVKIGETAGTIEHLTLRATWVRGLDGALTTIPNGSINQVANLSKEWSRAVLDVEVAYEEDLDRAMRVMLDAARQLKAEMPREILEDPVMLGLDRLTSGSAVLRLAVKTAPAKQGEVSRELRRRLKLACDREGIKTPPGQQSLILSLPPRAEEAAALEQLAARAPTKAEKIE